MFPIWASVWGHWRLPSAATPLQAARSGLPCAATEGPLHGNAAALHDHAPTPCVHRHISTLFLQKNCHQISVTIVNHRSVPLFFWWLFIIGFPWKLVAIWWQIATIICHQKYSMANCREMSLKSIRCRSFITRNFGNKHPFVTEMLRRGVFHGCVYGVGAQFAYCTVCTSWD